MKRRPDSGGVHRWIFKAALILASALAGSASARAVAETALPDSGNAQAQELRGVCADELRVHCPRADSLVPMSNCLTDHGEELSSACFEYLAPLNPGMRERIARHRAAALEAQRVRDAAAAKTAAEAEAARSAAAEAEAAKERQRTRLQLCEAEMRGDPHPPERRDIHSICWPFSMRPALTVEQETCAARLLRKTSRAHRRAGISSIRAREDFEEFCRSPGGDSNTLSCTEKRLDAGEEPFQAIRRCEGAMIRCEAFMKGSRPLSTQRAKFVRDFCLQYSGSFETPEECAAPRLPSLARLYPDRPEMRESEMALERAACAQRIVKKQPFLECVRETHPTRWRFLWDIPMLTHLCEQEPVYRSCVISRFFNLPDYIQNLSYPSLQEQQQEIHQTCLVRNALHHFDEKNRTNQRTSCP